MRLVLLQILVILLSCYSCYSETCDGTCVAMDSIGHDIDATCTKSADCLILSCDTPRKAKQYGAKAKPRIQIYPCEDPPVLNLQIDGSFLGSNFGENRNFTSDTDYSRTISIIGIHQTVLLHIRMSSDDRKITFKLTVTYNSNTYTVIPTTDIPIDKSGCDGVTSTTQNPLCFVATTQTTITTVKTTTGPTVTTTGPTVTTTGPTVSTTGPTVTTTGPTVSTTGPTVTSTGPTVSTTGPTVSTTGPTVSTTGPTVTATGPTVSTTGPTVTTTGPTVSTTGPTVTATGPTVSTTGPTVTTTGPTVSTTRHVGTATGPVVISHNSLSNTETPPQVSGGAIGGIVAAICILLLVAVTIATSFVLLIAHRRKMVKYSILKTTTIEM